jgi:hypothetical protein
LSRHEGDMFNVQELERRNVADLESCSEPINVTGRYESRRSQPASLDCAPDAMLMSFK